MPGPARVRKRDGRLEPFLLAKLAQGLRRARCEHAPHRAAAHAAELARAVAHFLALDEPDPVPTEAIRAQALTALREFGHEETARRFAAGAPAAPPLAPISPTALPADLPPLAREGALRFGLERRRWRMAWTTVPAAGWSGGGGEDFLQAAQHALAETRRCARRLVLRHPDLAAAASAGPPRIMGERLGWLLAAWGPRAAVRLCPAPGAAEWAWLDGGPLFGPPADAAARHAEFHAGLAAALVALTPKWAWLPLLEGALPSGTPWDEALRRGCRVRPWLPAANDTAECLAVARIAAPERRPGALAALAEAAVRGALAGREKLRRQWPARDFSAAALALVDARGDAGLAAELAAAARPMALAARLPLAPEPGQGRSFAMGANRDASAAIRGCRNLPELARAALRSDAAARALHDA